MNSTYFSQEIIFIFQIALEIFFYVQELREEVENWGGQARELQRVSRREVADLPPDTQVGFSITFWYGCGSADPCSD